MEGNWLTGSGWVIVVFIGAFVLFGAIVWSRRQNRTITPEQHRRTEEATHANYQDPIEGERSDR